MKLNPTALMKIAKAKNIFAANHPKFVKFLQAVLAKKIETGTVIELSVTKPGEEPVTTNIRVQESDLELLRGLKDLL